MGKPAAESETPAAPAEEVAPAAPVDKPEIAVDLSRGAFGNYRDPALRTPGCTEGDAQEERANS